MRRYLTLAITLAVVLGLHLFFLTGWPTSRYVINLAVLFIIAVTLRRGLIVGLTLATLVGLAETGMTVIAGPSHIFAQMAVAAGTWFISTKIFTSRSSASLIFTTVVATAMYAIAFSMSEATMTIFNRDRLSVPYLALGLAGLCTLVTHPIIISLVWRWRKWDRYSQVVS